MSFVLLSVNSAFLNQIGQWCTGTTSFLCVLGPCGRQHSSLLGVHLASAFLTSLTLQPTLDLNSPISLYSSPFSSSSLSLRHRAFFTAPPEAAEEEGKSGGTPETPPGAAPLDPAHNKSTRVKPCGRR